MSTPKDLNNSVVIPARNIREYSANSLATGNTIGKVNVSNNNFLKSYPQEGLYKFADSNVVTGTHSTEWENIYSGSVSFGGEYTNTDEEQQILSQSQTSSVSDLKLQCTIKYFMNAGNILNKSAEENYGVFYLQNGDSKTFSYKFTYTSGAARQVGTIYATISYNNGILSAVCYAEATNFSNNMSIKEWTCELSLNVDKLSSTSIGDISEKNGIGYFFAESTCSLMDGNEILTIPLSSWTSLISGKNGFTTTLANGETSIQENIAARIVPVFFSSLLEFKQYCTSTISSELSGGNYKMFVGFKKSAQKSYADHLRFNSNFEVYTCTALYWNTAGYSFSDYTLSLLTEQGTAYKREDKVETVGIVTSESNEFTITANSLLQEATNVNGLSLGANMASKVFNQFKNGRNTVSLSIFYDKYLDLDGTLVYNGVDGNFVKTDDIITPYTIRTSKNMEGFVEVPLLVDHYTIDSDNKQVPVGKQFYVTSCTLEYDGDFRIDLAGLEKTD